MIIHKLLFRWIFNRDDTIFYVMQANDSISWLESKGFIFNSDMKILDLGCGHGIFGFELIKRRCNVTFADYNNYLPEHLKKYPFIYVNLEDDNSYSKLGQYDLVICSNVLEHISSPEKFIVKCQEFLKPGGKLYLCWTNWLSPFGGHEFTPLQYLGPKLGSWIYYKLTGVPSSYTKGDLYVTYIGKILKIIRNTNDIKISKMATRYYPEFSFLLKMPILREFFAWNCALLISKV